MESISVTLAFLINWGWLRIGPYIHISIDPVLLHIGPLALHWYDLMYPATYDIPQKHAGQAEEDEQVMTNSSQASRNA